MSFNVPIYAPLHDQFKFDAAALKLELDQKARPVLQERTLSFKNERSIYDPKGSLKIADDELLNDTSRYIEHEDGSRDYVAGKYKTYHALNACWLPEEPDSEFNIYRFDDPKKTIFWHQYMKPFTWREEFIDGPLYKAVMQFPWEYIQGVRVLCMDPPSIGQAHKDSATLANKKFFGRGHASISFNVDHGGGVLKYLDDSEKDHEVDNDVRVFHFDDSAPHGVTPITSRRYQVRMWGKLAVPYTELMDLDRAVWR